MKSFFSAIQIAGIFSLAALLLGSIVPSAWAQTAIQPGSVIGTFEGQNYSTNVVFTAPEGKYSRVTDLILSNYGADTACGLNLQLGPYILYIRVPPSTSSGSLIVPLNSGYGLAPGAIVGNSTVTACTGQVYVIVRGFYYTIP